LPSAWEPRVCIAGTVNGACRGMAVRFVAWKAAT